MRSAGETFMPPPNGHAWEDARAASVRRSVAKVYRLSADLAVELVKLRDLTGQPPWLAERTDETKALFKWATEQVAALGIPDGDLPASALSPRRARRSRG